MVEYSQILVLSLGFLGYQKATKEFDKYIREDPELEDLEL